MAVVLLPPAARLEQPNPYWRRAEGVTEVKRIPPPDAAVLPRGDAARLRAKKAGILYEAGVHRLFSREFEGYVPSPWFRFTDAREKNRLAQFDALVFPPLAAIANRDLSLEVPHSVEPGANPALPLPAVLLLEVKTTHCLEAWHQLRRFYEPIARAYLPGARIVLVEVCRTFYPNMRWPEEAHFCDDLSDALSLPDGALAITQLLKVPRR